MPQQAAELSSWAWRHRQLPSLPPRACLQLAATQGHADVVRCLLVADPSTARAQDKDGWVSAAAVVRQLAVPAWLPAERGRLVSGGRAGQASHTPWLRPLAHQSLRPCPSPLPADAADVRRALRPLRVHPAAGAGGAQSGDPLVWRQASGGSRGSGGRPCILRITFA